MKFKMLSWGFTVVNRHQYTLIRTFNWGWLINSEAQSIIIKAGAWQHPGRHGGGGAEREFYIFI
jgi:hypothetical protein